MRLSGNLRAFAIGSFAVASLLNWSGLANAKSPMGTWRVEPSSLRIITNDDQQIGVERTIRPNDEILRAAIGVAAASELLEDLKVEMSGEQWQVPKGALLGGVKVLDAPHGVVINPQRTFCGKMIQLSSNTQSMDRNARFCFTDVDQDSKLDHVFVAGSKRPEDATLRPIAPTSYDYRENVPLPNTYITIAFYDPPKAAFDFNGRQLVASVTFMGEKWSSLEHVTTRIMGKRKPFKAYQTVAGKYYPRTLEFGAVKITILAFQKEVNEILLRVDHGFDTVDIESVYG